MDKQIQVVNFDETAMTPEVMQAQVNVIQKVMKQVMKNGEHFGTIPGCGDKPTLLKPGAEKLCTTFRLAPSYQITKSELTGGHREYEIFCTLTHIPTNQIIAEGVGLCTSMESRYRWRTSERECPVCKKNSIIKGQEQYGGGWLCWKKKDGCGAKFSDDDKSIVDQKTGRMENPDIADQFNTVLKIAKKRAHVDAVLTATAASDLFTQDIEDMPTAPMENLAPKEPVGQTVTTSTTKSQPPQQEPPPYQEEPPQSNSKASANTKTTPSKTPLTTADMRAELNKGYPAEDLFIPFLVNKKWLQKGQTLNNLTDNQVERLFNNSKQLETLYREAIKNG